MLTIENATKETVFRERIAAHRSWIETELGCLLPDAVIVEVPFSFTQVAILELLNYPNSRYIQAESVCRLQKIVRNIKLLPQFTPAILAEVVPRPEFTLAQSDNSLDRYSLHWLDCPISFELSLSFTKVVAINVEYQTDPTLCSTSVAHLAIVRSSDLSAVLGALTGINEPNTTSRLHTPRSHPRVIAPCDWTQIVLDPDVIALLKNDFESFFERYDWFKAMRLPFRRGYLLHGPPGNGKTTAIRAMLTSRGLSAHTIHFFDSRTDDSDLDALFARAEQNRPAVVLLEDIDRAFPKTGATKTKVSLQQLLNCLDGLGTSEGIIVIATANEPTILDPAILRRPGRFDRVVHFANPSAALRRQYFQRMHHGLSSIDLDDAVLQSDGFSFAFLREAYILAGQRAFEDCRDIRVEDLELAVNLLRDTMRQTSRPAAQAGFKAPTHLNGGK